MADEDICSKITSQPIQVIFPLRQNSENGNKGAGCIECQLHIIHQETEE